MDEAIDNLDYVLASIDGVLDAADEESAFISVRRTRLLRWSAAVREALNAVTQEA